MLNFLIYLGTSAGLLLIGAVAFLLSTKISEWELIKAGNVAAALTLGGKLLGLSVVLYASVTYSVSIPDLLQWGAVGIISLIVAYHLFELLTPKFRVQDAIAADNRAVGAVVFFLLLSLGAIVGACLSY